MKTKTIKTIIRRKVEAWLATITDEALKKDIREGTIVTGGCIVSMLLNEEINDYDVYFRTHDLALRVATYYVAKFMEKPPSAWSDQTGKLGYKIEIRSTKPDEKQSGRISLFIKSAGIIGEGSQNYDYFESRPEENADKYIESTVVPQVAKADDMPIDMDRIDSADETEIIELGETKTDEKSKDEKKGQYRPIFLSANSITLYNKVQLVFRFFGEPSVIHSYYDYVHCTNFWSSWDDALVLPPRALECILAKELVYQGSLYPICSLFRMRKFIQRGWTITAGQVLKMALQISKLDLEKIDVLNDQLVGVDAAYFTDLMCRIQKENADHDRVDGAYVMKVIDQLF